MKAAGRKFVKLQKWNVFLVFLGIYVQNKTLAAESSELTDRFKLVGVISDDDRPGNKKGVAVLKDIKNGVTMTLRTGDRIPYESTLKVIAVLRHKVLLGDDLQKAEISYYGTFDTPNTKNSFDLVNSANHSDETEIEPSEANQILMRNYSPIEMLDDVLED